MAQFSRPVSDISTGGWTTTPLWSKLDDNSDADFVTIDPDSTSNSFTCGSGSVTDPLVATGYVMRFRARRSGAGGPTWRVGIRHHLYEGTTLRATNSVNLLNTSFTTHAYTLTAAEANSISNHANLRHVITRWNLNLDTPDVAWCELEVPTATGGGAVPAKVTGLAATDGVYFDKTRLTWNHASGAASYKVFRHTSNNFGASTLIKSGLGGELYDDTTGTQGVVYYYWVGAHNSAGDGVQSDPNTGYRFGTPGPPTGVAASDGTYTDKVVITWSAAANTDSYRLRRDGVIIQSGITALTYSDTTAVAPTVYSYEVISHNDAGNSAPSTANTGYRAEVVTPPPDTTSPITNFSATDGAFQGRVRMTWDEYPEAASYSVQRSLTAVFPTEPFISGLTDNAYDDTAVAPGQVYYYRVYAVTSIGNTDPSGTDTGYAATSSLRFFQEFLKAMIDVLFKGTSSVSGLSATPTIEFEGITDAYEFDPSDTGYASIPAGAKVGLTHSYDGTDEDEMMADDGALSLVDAPMPVDAGSDPVRQIILWSDHGSYEPLVCLQDSFFGAPFEVRGGDSPKIQWSRLAEAVFRLAGRPAPGVVYPFAFENALYALLGGSARHVLPSAAPTIKVNFLTSSGHLVTEHRYLSDIPDVWFAISEAAAVSLTSVTTSNVGTSAAKVTAADATFTTPSSSNPNAYYALVYIHNADPDLALLLLCWPLDNAIVFDNTNIVLQFDATTGIWQFGD